MCEIDESSFFLLKSETLAYDLEVFDDASVIEKRPSLIDSKGCRSQSAKRTSPLVSWAATAAAEGTDFRIRTAPNCPV